MAADSEQLRSQIDYTIACICPMGVELAAVEGMLDDMHDPLPLGRTQNAYTLGKIGVHNIVVAVMPGIGNNAAAAVATQLLNDFHSIRFALLVGIGGGVPGTVDVRLGDVVVSQATQTNGGVVQYDLGKRVFGGHFQRIGFLNKPPQTLSANVRKLDGQHRRQGHRLSHFMSEMLYRWPRMQETYAYPAGARDDLFRSTYSHVSGTICDQCDVQQIIPRSKRTSKEPLIHYGTIGSANTVVKDAVLRDSLREDMDLLCVEMEAAGLMNDFPCLIIRGICDYADSHKNKEWQPYSAGVAAAYMKELLLSIPAQEVARASEVVDATPTDIFASLAFQHMKSRQLDVRMRPPHLNTCRWILNTGAYQEWDAQPHGLLWIKGKPGAGKSTIMSFLYNSKFRRPCDDADIWLEFFFSAKGTQLQHTLVGMLRSMLNQLLQLVPQCRAEVRRYYREKCVSFGQRTATWEWHEQELQSLLIESILTAAQCYRVSIFVDALDETGESAARVIAEYFHHLNQRAATASAPVKICMSCRHYPIVSTGWGAEICVEDHNHSDIAIYVQDRFKYSCQSIGSDELDIEQWLPLQASLVEKTRGSFQWIRLVMSIVEKSIMDGATPEEVRLDIQDLPKEISDVYEHVLLNVINPRSRSQSFLLFQWICLAEKPLTVAQMRYAIAASKLNPQSSHWQPMKCDETPGFIKTNEAMKQRIRALSGGLLEVMNDRVQAGHQTVNEYLMQRGLALLASISTTPSNTPCTSQSSPSIKSGPEALLYQCHSRLYWSLLNYLLTERIADESKIVEFNYNETIKVLAESPLIDYAAENVFIHAEKAKQYRSQNLHLEHKLINRVLLPYISIYWGFCEHSAKTLKEGTTVLHIAASAGLFDLVVYLLEKHEKCDPEDGWNNTPLHHAAHFGHEQIVKILLHAGANVNARTQILEDHSPLTLAATTGHLGVIDLLIRQGADLSHRADTSGNALHIATNNGHVQAVLLLLAAGADVNSEVAFDGCALQAASSKGRENIVRILLSAGADVNLQGGYYGNALQAASANGHQRVVQILLAAGADVNAEGGSWETALIAAADHGHEGIVEILLEAGADTRVQCPRCGYALHAAIQSVENERMVQMLIQAGSDVNVMGRSQCALPQAVFYGHENTVKILLEAGVDVEARGLECLDNALQAACYWSHENLVKILLEAGSDVNASPGEHGTALHAACYKSEEAIVRMLLERGANVDANVGEHGTPLQVAARGFSDQIVTMLIDAGADVNIQGGWYGGALNAAIACDRTSFIQLLRDAGAVEFAWVDRERPRHPPD